MGIDAVIKVRCRRCNAEIEVPAFLVEDVGSRQWICRHCSDSMIIDCLVCSPIPENNWNPETDSPLNMPLCWTHQEQLVPRWAKRQGLPIPDRYHRVLPGVGETIKARWPTP